MNHDAYPRNHGLIRLLIAQTQVIFNDNAAKLALIGLVGMAVSVEARPVFSSLIPLLLVLPFVLFSPICGWLADRFPKYQVMRWALWLQVAVMVLLLAALAAHWLWLVIACFFLLALQSTIFSPAKQGIPKEIVGSEGLGRVAGWMELLAILAILGGGLGGGWLFDTFSEWQGGDPWRGAFAAVAVLTLACLVSIAVFQPCGGPAASPDEAFRGSLFFDHFHAVGDLWKRRGLWFTALGMAYFYSLGGVIYLTLVQAGKELHPEGFGATTASGILLCCLGAGIAIGSLISVAVCRRRIELGLVPVGGLGMAVALAASFFTEMGGWAYGACLVALGVCGALFVVPLNAHLQDGADPEMRGRLLAAGNLLTNLGGILAVGLYFAMATWCGFTSGTQLLVLALPTVAVSLLVILCMPEALLRLGGLVFGHLVYRIRVDGEEHMPKTGGVLLVCNHVSYIDTVILQLASPRPIRFMAYEAFFHIPALAQILKAFKTIPVSPTRAKDAITKAAAALQKGEVVCIFPEGELTRTGSITAFRKGFELIARKAGTPVLPVHLDSLWGSIFSFEGDRYFTKLPRRLPYPVAVSFGEPIPAEAATAAAARRQILDLGEAAFRRRGELEESLASALFRALRGKPWREVVADGAEGKSWKALEILACALALGLRGRKNWKGTRIGIALPPGPGAVLANLGVVFSGKIPANLNLTAGPEAAQACLDLGGIETVLTAAPVRAKCPGFPWPAATVNVEEELKGLSKAALARLALACLAYPDGLLRRRFGIREKGGDAEAVLLFTSGSSGTPKGVPLSHRNVLANVAQIRNCNMLRGSDTMLGCLPLFHSLGLTFTLWFPLLQACKLCTTPSPLDAREVGRVAAARRATILLGTPTFLRSWMRRVEPEQFKTLRMTVVGAEKLPDTLREEFQTKFGCGVFEGYGLTECSPVLAVGQPAPICGWGADSLQIGSRPGSVGRFLPGITYRLLDPDTREEAAEGSAGLLAVKGANIFNGYVKQPELSAQVLQDGWFTTGDLVRVEEDGFVFIEGRLTRFSKIGGEMVPHGKIEEALHASSLANGAEGPAFVVVGVPDEAKGEALVLLTTAAADAAAVREALNAAGLPNLWIPKEVRKLEKIPVLGAGKLDLKECKKLAMSWGMGSCRHPV
jgi:acyl-[acyl-carrier-protein]-phospholipid O-acyltransferase/long-chain-fatty-acid--[acyl-carrier-protein] ligase